MFIVLAILAFGVIIAIHELGHYFAAKAMGVKVNEFAIGMGPKILKKQGKETLYSLRLLPFGGFCSMEGEHEEGEEPDPRSFLSQKRWKRIVILAAGSLANIIAAFIIILFLTASADGFAGTTITETAASPIAGEVSDFVEGDRVLAINGERLFYFDDFNLFMRLYAGSSITFTVERNGEQLDVPLTQSLVHTVISNVVDNLPDEGPVELIAGDIIVAINGERPLFHGDYSRLMQKNADETIILTLYRDGELVEYESRTYLVDGEEVHRYLLSFSFSQTIFFNAIEPTFIEVINYSFYQMYSFIRMIRLSIAMMISGTASFQDISGPVGIVNEMNNIGQSTAAAQGIVAAIGSIVFFTAFIGVNVAIINLLPIPAMDGGRILFIGITWVIEKVTRKKLDPKYEGYINTTAFILLIGLMVFVLYNDVVRIIGN